MYSVNQVNQMYVVTDLKTSLANVSTDSVGTLYGPLTGKGFTYLKYKGVGGLMATDRIKKRKVKWISYTTAAKMRKPLKKWTITLETSTPPITAGQDYIIRFAFKNYFGMSDEDTYEKFASARAFSNSTSNLYRDLALSLAKNMSREIDKPFKIELSYSTSSLVEVLPEMKASDLTSTYTGIVLSEIEQPWHLGRYKQARPDFSIHFSPVVISAVEYTNWATVTEANQGSSYFIGNGAETADLEWFFMGERGDQYRGKDWPLSISTPASLLVDASKEYNYLIVHFWDDIDNEGPQKSERDMTLVAEAKVSNGVDLLTLGESIAEEAGLDHIFVTDASHNGEAVAVGGDDDDDDSSSNG